MNNSIKKNFLLTMLDVEISNVPMNLIFAQEIMNFQNKTVIQLRKECIQVVNMYIKVDIDFYACFDKIINFILERFTYENILVKY